MHVISPRELNAATERIRVSAPLHERRRHAEPDQCEPREREQIDAREDPEPGHAYRKESEVAHGQRDGDVPSAPDRAYERDRARVRGRQEERPETDDDGDPDWTVELGGGDPQQCWPDAERQRGPEAGAVELDRLSDELPDRAPLRRKRRRQRCVVARHVPNLAGFRKDGFTVHPVDLELDA